MNDLHEIFKAPKTLAEADERLRDEEVKIEKLDQDKTNLIKSVLQKGDEIFELKKELQATKLDRVTELESMSKQLEVMQGKAVELEELKDMLKKRVDPAKILKELEGE